MATQQKREDLERTGPNPLQVQQFRCRFDYPAGKRGALRPRRSDGADANGMEAHERIPGGEHDGATAVLREVGNLD